MMKSSKPCQLQLDLRITGRAALIRGGGDQPGKGRRYNLIEYALNLAGSSTRAVWGENDTWEMALGYILGLEALCGHPRLLTF